MCGLKCDEAVAPLQARGSKRDREKLVKNDRTRMGARIETSGSEGVLQIARCKAARVEIIVKRGRIASKEKSYPERCAD